VSLLLSLMMMSSTVVLPGGENGMDVELTCEVGPIDRDYGGSAFSVFSCDDGKSVVAVAKPGTKAYPFYFIVSPNADGEVLLYGQGDGDNEAGRDAFAELNEVRPAQVAELVAATRAQAKPAG
jgi:hypothetical protein